MRKLIFLLLVAICGCGCLSADEIVLRDATSLNGVVKEVRPDKVLFRKRGENFDREISVDKVFKIKYDNGTEEKLATLSSPVKKDETSVDYIRNGRYYNVSTQPNYSVFPPASKVYYVGDWYSENGVEGIVVETTPDGRHGRIISHRDAPLKNFNNGHGWGFWFKGGKDVPIGTNDRSNGYANLQKLRAFQKAHPEYDSEMFPVQTALDEWGSGWYVPSIDEMANLSRLLDTKINYTGEVAKFKGKNVKWEKVIKHQAKEHGGKFKFNVYALTSTENFSQGGASSWYNTLYGDPDQPQFVVYKLEAMEKGKPVVKEFCRDRAMFVVPFHLF